MFRFQLSGITRHLSFLISRLHFVRSSLRFPEADRGSFRPSLGRGDTACVRAPHLLYPRSGPLHSGCFCVLAVGPRAAMILAVRASFKALVFLGSTRGYGMAASHVRWVLSCLPLQCRELVMDVMNPYIIEPGRR